MTVVDTSVWVEYLSGRESSETLWLDRELSDRRVLLLDIVLCEVLQGVRLDDEHARVRGELLKLPILSVGGSDMALAASSNYRVLRARGFTIRKTADCLIATFCMQRGYPLLHRDRDFDPFEEHLGLKVVRPLSMQFGYFDELHPRALQTAPPALRLDQEEMRSRAAHFACLLLLLSSLAVTNARAGGVAPSRTPGGVFVRNLLLRAVVEEAEPGLTSFGRDESAAFTVENAPVPSRTFWVAGPVAQTAHVHAVTGSSL